MAELSRVQIRWVKLITCIRFKLNLLELSVACICSVLSCTLKFVVLDYDKFSRSEFVAEVMLSLLDVDLVEGTTVSRHLNSKTIINVSAESYQAVTLLTCFITFFNLSRMHLLLLPWLPWLTFL